MRLVASILGLTLLTSCAVNEQRPVQYDRKGAQPVVSASRGSGEYISRGQSEYASYISALEEAQKEQQFGAQTRSGSAIDDYISNLSGDDFNVATLSNNQAQIANEIQANSGNALSELWGKPADSVVEGVTLLNPEVRERFNDALTTTPVSSQARWRYGETSFIFMPNSEIFQPFYSGGNCRDGVFVSLLSGNEERVRGLFCQKGRGADWYLVR